jgi:hypothetical protein
VKEQSCRGRLKGGGLLHCFLPRACAEPTDKRTHQPRMRVRSTEYFHSLIYHSTYVLHVEILASTRRGHIEHQPHVSTHIMRTNMSSNLLYILSVTACGEFIGNKAEYAAHAPATHALRVNYGDLPSSMEVSASILPFAAFPTLLEFLPLLISYLCLQIRTLMQKPFASQFHFCANRFSGNYLYKTPLISPPTSPSQSTINQHVCPIRRQQITRPCRPKGDQGQDWRDPRRPREGYQGHWCLWMDLRC